MLFVDKYRPKSLDELHYHQDLSDRLRSLVSQSSDELMMLLFHLCFCLPFKSHSISSLYLPLLVASLDYRVHLKILYSICYLVDRFRLDMKISHIFYSMDRLELGKRLVSWP